MAIRNWLLAALALVGAAAFVTIVTSVGHEQDFVGTFLYILVGLIAGAAAMNVTVRAFADFAESRVNRGYIVAAGWLLGLFFVTPTILGAAFQLLAAVLPR